MSLPTEDRPAKRRYGYQRSVPTFSTGNKEKREKIKLTFVAATPTGQQETKSQYSLNANSFKRSYKDGDAKNQKPKELKGSLTSNQRDVLQLLLKCRPINLHFIDFQLAFAEKNKVIANEIGIVSCQLNSFEIKKKYNKVIECGYLPEYEGFFNNHGIDCRSIDENQKKTKDLIQQDIIEYFKEFKEKTSYLIVRDDTILTHYECMKDLFKGEFPDNFIMFPYHDLIKIIGESKNIKTNELNNKNINSIYKQIIPYVEEECEYHQTIDRNYLCSLRNVSCTMTTVFYCIKKYYGFILSFENENKLPSINEKRTSFDLQSPFVFINCSYYGNVKKPNVYEVLLTQITFENDEFKRKELPALIHLLPEDTEECHSTFEIIKNEIGNTTNEEIMDFINSLLKKGDENQVIVQVDPKISRVLPLIETDKYMVITKLELIKKVIEYRRGTTPENVDAYLSYLKDITFENEPIHCSIHENNSKECCLCKYDKFVKGMNYLAKNLGKIERSLNPKFKSFDPNDSVPIVPKRNKDYPDELSREDLFVKDRTVYSFLSFGTNPF